MLLNCFSQNYIQNALITTPLPRCIQNKKISNSLEAAKQLNSNKKDLTNNENQKFNSVCKRTRHSG